MTLTKPQVRQLRGLAHHCNPTVWIGKNGVSDKTLRQADQSLEDHELIKCVVLDGSPIDAREVGELLASRLNADIVQIIGHRCCLYRPSSKTNITPIRLVRRS